MEVLIVSDNISIPLSELEFSYARSGGPGGQNVNKVNSKAVLRWSVCLTDSLPYAVRARFIARYSSRLTVEGDLVLTSQRYRDQPSNVQDCLDKLRQMILDVEQPPTIRRPTRPTLAAKRKRVEAKTQQSAKKQQRRAPRDFE